MDTGMSPTDHTIADRILAEAIERSTAQAQQIAATATAATTEALRAEFSAQLNALQSALQRNTSTPPAKKYKVPKPDTYAGERDALAIDNFIFNVREYIDLEELQEPYSIRVAAFFLKGDALQLWRSALKQQTNWTLNSFFEHIRTTYYPANYVNDRRQALDALRQGNSPIVKHNHAFQHILAQIPEDLYSKHDMLYRYCCSLNADLRKTVSAHDPATLLEAYKLAERCGSTQEAISKERPSTNPSHTPMELDAFERQNGRTFSGYSARQTTQARCYNCNRPGHFSRDCRSPKTPSTLAAERRKQAPLAVKQLDTSLNISSEQYNVHFSEIKPASTKTSRLAIPLNETLISGIVDSGAGTSVLNSTVAADLNLPIQSTTATMQTADGNISAIHGKTRVQIDGDDKDVYCTPLNDDTDIILGYDWMKETDATFDYLDGSVTFTNKRGIRKHRTPSPHAHRQLPKQRATANVETMSV